MEYKVKYLDKIKKLLTKKVTSLATLRETVKTSFPDLPNDFIVYYYDGDDNIDLEHDDDFESMVE